MFLTEVHLPSFASQFLRRAALALSAFLVALPLGTDKVRAGDTELLMFEADGCSYCERWHDEIGEGYHLTEESRVAPLRTIDIDENRPSEFEHIKGVRYTPTFVVLDKGREVGRIIGHPGEEFFWPLIGDLLKKVEPDTSSLANRGQGDNACRTC